MNNRLMFMFSDFEMFSTMDNRVSISSRNGDFCCDIRIYKDNDHFSIFNSMMSIHNGNVITSDFHHFNIVEVKQTRGVVSSKFGFYLIFSKGDGDTGTELAFNFFYPSRALARKGFKAFKEYLSIKRGF